MEIHKRLVGQTIVAALTDGEKLILRLTTGEEVEIGWDEKNGPVFLRQNVRLTLLGIDMSGTADLTGGTIKGL